MDTGYSAASSEAQKLLIMHGTRPELGLTDEPSYGEMRLRAGERLCIDLRMGTSWKNKGGMGTILKYMRDEGVGYMSNVAMAFLNSKRKGSQGGACTRWIVGYLGCKQARG